MNHFKILFLSETNLTTNFSRYSYLVSSCFMFFIQREAENTWYWELDWTSQTRTKSQLCCRCLLPWGSAGFRTKSTKGNDENICLIHWVQYAV